LKQSGVYFLFGTSDQMGESVVYIGQAGARKNGEGIFYRLQEHKRNPDKYYWTDAVVFTTTNNSFGTTEISYLENRFCNLATEAKRYVVKNGNDPTPGNATEEKESELEEFINYARIIIGTLGHEVFVPLNDLAVTSNSQPANDDHEPLLYLKTSKSKATGRRTSEGFVVFKDSQVATVPTKSCPDTMKHLRAKYADKIDQNAIMIEDILFSSICSRRIRILCQASMA